MKICYLSESSIPSPTANSVQVMKMCQAFARAGHEVVLVAMSGDPGYHDQDAFAFYGVDPCFAIRRIENPRIRGGRYLYDLGAAVTAIRERAELAYGRSFRSCFFATQIGLQVIYEAHTTLPRAGGVSRRLLRWFFESDACLRVVAISAALATALVRDLGVSPHRILVAHDGADPPRDEAVRLGPEDRMQVGYVGQLYPGKGIEVIVPLAEACPWADFHVIGGSVSAVARWKQSRIPQNLRFHGHLPPGQLDAYRRGFDALLAPYQPIVTSSGGGDVAAWMSPLKIFEYMAAARPILCSDLPVLREILQHGRNALLCPPDDVPSWTEALQSLRNDPELAGRLGTTAQYDFEAEYTWDARARKVLRGVHGATISSRELSDVVEHEVHS
jgi:glycosyltransferase involved in cell wall biosynthesis